MGRAIFIRGTDLDLVCLTKVDAPLVHRWSTDMEVIHAWGSQPIPVDLATVEERMAAPHKQGSSLMLGMQLKNGSELIGVCGLSHIEWPWQRAELSIAIGDPEHRGKGYGSEAVRLILDHAFTRLNLHSVMLRVISYNERAIKCYEACGFKHAGRRREARIEGGKYHDVLFMDILAKEFKLPPGETSGQKL